MQAADKRRRERKRTLGAVGEPPPNPFGGVPVAELLILAGIAALVVWLVVGGTPALIVGIVVLLCGVLEFTVREHISGYRSHTILLSAIPAVLFAAVAITISGERTGDAPMLATAIPVFLLAFFPLRRRFQNARQARVARVAQPPDA
jgi:Flp pilus assembly protein TadB